MIIAAVIYATSCSCEKKTAMIIPHLITSRIVGQQIKKRFSSFSTSTVTLYFVSPGGKGGSKNYQEIKKGAELIQLLLTGVGGGQCIIISPSFEAHFLVPPPDNYCTVPK